MKNLWLAFALFVGSGSALFGNGGAWQAGIPATGNASASKNDRHTDVTIENETLKIDLHPEYAAVEVRYRMHNSGRKVQQDFFFPVERWGRIQTADMDRESDDIDRYQISIDGKELKSNNVVGPKQKGAENKQEASEPKHESSEAEEQGSEEDAETTSGPLWQEEVSTIKSWKKSVIPFERNQTRDVTIHYKARYAENDESVSDDSHISNATFAYSLSPAATWKGPIREGKVEINILHPEPEDVSIAKPKDRFKKLSDTRYKWEFENLKPTMADDIRIIAHSKYDSYPTGYSEEELQNRAEYVIRGNQYFLDHSDYDATASSTLAAQGKHNYDVVNVKGDPTRDVPSPWAEGVEGDGIGESITLNVKRPLPLYGIRIQPGYYEYDDKEPWLKNNRVAALEITLNDEHTFTESIPDERFERPYLIRVRDYAKPVNKIKMVIKGVHRGTKFRDTCVSLVKLRAPLDKKPEVHGAR
ncbi:MAG: NADase-type glycan-binding domain-containing protein [Candidatus Udaeobacter sp.]